MTTPQDATEALTRALDVLAFHMMGRHPGDEHAPAIAAALAADGWSVVRTEDVERWRRVEAAAGDIAELLVTPREYPRSTVSVLAHVQAERSMQIERWGWRQDANYTDRDWNELIEERLTMPGASRYIRLVQVAALAIAAAERQHSLDEAHDAD